MKLTIEQRAQIQLALRERLKLEGLNKVVVKSINEVLDMLKYNELIVIDSTSKEIG